MLFLPLFFEVTLRIPQKNFKTHLNIQVPAHLYTPPLFIVGATKQLPMAVSFAVQQQPPRDLHDRPEQSGSLVTGLGRNGQVCGRLVSPLLGSQEKPTKPK